MVSSDDIVHELYARPEIVAAIREHYGERVMSGAVVSRPALGRVVFADLDELQWLEDLLHPYVHTGVEEWARLQIKARPRPALLVAEVPLLFEAGMEDDVRLRHAGHGAGRRCVAGASPQKLTDSEFARRLAQQMPEDGEGRAQRLRLRQHRPAQGAARLRRPDGGAASSPPQAAGAARARRHGEARPADRPGARRRGRPRGRRAAGSSRSRPAPEAPGWYARVAYPLEYDGAIRAAARRNHLDPALVAAVIYAESRFDAHARLGARRRGAHAGAAGHGHTDRARDRRRGLRARRPPGPRSQRALRLPLPAHRPRPVRRRHGGCGRRLQRRRRRGARLGRAGARPRARPAASPTSPTRRRAPTCAACCGSAGSTARPTETVCARAA